MYICELLPLKTTKKIDTLSYFTSLDINVGDLAEINMNGQILSALVIGVTNIKNSKTEIRSQDFKIKKRLAKDEIFFLLIIWGCLILNILII